MKYQFYHDTETDEILSYSELKELHADLVRFQETEIKDFNSYLNECVKNGCLLGAIKLEVHDIQQIATPTNMVNYLKSGITFYMDTWKNIYTNKGLYVACYDDELKEDFNRFLSNLKG